MISSRSNSDVSQKTIAEHLQVSIATVSKALSNKPDISHAMCIKVAQAAKELGYTNGNANQRRKNKVSNAKSQFIGVFLRKPLDGGGKNAATYMDGMSQIASKRNASLIVQEWRYTDDPNQILMKQHQPPALRDGLLTGVALGGEWPAETVNALSQRHQVVTFPQPIIGSNVDVVGLDNMSAMLQLIDRLKRLGHERIGFLGRCGTMGWACDRFAGYVGGLDRMGLTYQPEWAIEVDEAPMLNEGYEDYWHSRVDLIESARQNDGVEAWLCSSDWPAFQLYRGMADRGYEIPKDISIAGFDDTEPLHLGCPPVTSVKIPREVIGAAVLKRLLHRIENPDSLIRQSNFPCQLMFNGTLGKPTYASVHMEESKEVAV